MLEKAMLKLKLVKGYALTAFDSTMPRGLPHAANKVIHFKWLKNRSRPLPLEPFCGEYILLLENKMQPSLAHKMGSLGISFTKAHKDTIEVPSLSVENAYLMLFYRRIMSLFRWWSQILMPVIFISGLVIYKHLVPAQKLWLVSLILSFIIMFWLAIFALIWWPNKKYAKLPVSLNRFTGMVNIPLKDGTVRSIQFDEFKPCYTYSIKLDKALCYSLWYVHGYSKLVIRVVKKIDLLKLLLVRDLLQQFMDISKPLPDIPALEDYRFSDPTTSYYDNKNQRNADYWASMSNEEFKLHYRSAEKRACHILDQTINLMADGYL